MEYPALVPGTLLRRYKRFLADIELDDGRVVVAHCPNTGSMRAVNVPGCRVWLSPSDNPKRKLAWTWELIELPQADDGLATASVQTGRANAIVEEALRDGVIAPLAGFETLRREATVAESRLDFRLDAADGGATYVEVKQVTLKESDGHGYFPDAVSERGRKHLTALARLAAEGQRAVLLFCVAHEGIDAVAPAAHLDPAYAATLREVAERGVEVLAYRCAVEREAGVPRAIRLAQRLPVRLARTLVAPDQRSI
ncbi:DNA/RNA nuclease SfsA [Franzmannia qiaohouensis]|uniref:Sugar fermentation stimulation protein homolog n=1 Tax=Franzmannia qiaohouensis TaxID=1329370 RepID=A0ABU1HAI3_9GAMM|nr:DNA/RNA nuclease SfsA [Halomonas qiaohouensis]MDR5903660.1 DNA/RNA nuclease SfsA [Halomonas qiaohouensis]